jgi:hypothetical protein
MKIVIFVINLLFVLYYGYVSYVFYKLYQNTCQCKKLEDFKKTWNFHYISVVSPLFFVYGLFNLKNSVQSQKGGSMYHNVIIMVSLGYLASFLNDFAILNLLNTMEHKECPCQTKHRKRLTGMTYVKLVSNIVFYLGFIHVFDTKMFQKIKKRVQRRNIKG